jgi:integrase
VQKLTAKHLDAFYAEKRRAGCSEWILAKCHQRLRQVLGYALRQDIVARNVGEAGTAPHEERKEMQTWSREQVLRFLAVANQSTYGRIWLLALATGMRRGELLGLRWSDVHLDGTTLHVRQTLVALKQGPRIKDQQQASCRHPSRGHGCASGAPERSE